MYKSKTRESAKVFSNYAGTVRFDQSHIPGDTLNGTNPIGTATYEQLEFGISYPNTQAAIEEIATLFQHKINEVVTIVEDPNNPTQTPEGVNMTARLNIDGVAIKTAPIKVYGVPVILSRNDNRAQITDKIIAALNVYRDKKIAFKNVSKVAGEDSKIDVTFIDTQRHDLFSIVDNGVTITSSIVTEPISGYGTWEYLGKSQIQEPLTSGKVIKLKYFKRIA